MMAETLQEIKKRSCSLIEVLYNIAYPNKGNNPKKIKEQKVTKPLFQGLSS